MKNYLILLLISITFNCFGQQHPIIKCMDNTFGYWTYEGVPADILFVIQKLDEHKEYAENGTCSYDFQIIWKCDCEYDLMYEGINCKRTALSRIGELTSVTIVKIELDTLYYISTFRDMQESGKMIKIKSK